jgi:hypothetical protein
MLDLGHEQSLGDFGRKHKAEVRRDSGHQGVISSSDALDPVTIAVG